MRTLEEVKHAFSPVAKLDASQTGRLNKLQIAFMEIATEILDLVPECADRTSALRKVLEAKMECVQAVTHSMPGATKHAKDQDKN